jgi:drug/metabolite transporter (DMT)-like permease
MISSEHHNLRASLLMVGAMACFALEDVLIKQLATAMPTGQVLMLIGAGGGMVFGLLTWLSGRALVSRALLLRPVLVRNLSEATGSVMFILALVFTTLSGASAILQATPLAVTLGAALFLGERVGWRRWTAIGIGFIGVLLIIQPGLAGFTPASLFSAGAVFLLAARDLASRAVPADVASVQLASWGFLSLVPGGVVVLWVIGDPVTALAAPDVLRLAAALLIGCLGYYAIIAATRIGQISAVVPFRYTRLVFALVLGAVVFGERPDALMLLGSALVIGTGLYTIWRAAVLRRRS